MGMYVELFGDLRLCPVCGKLLRLEKITIKTCPQGDIRFQLRKTTQRWYLTVEMPKSRIRIVETGELFDTQKEVAAHIGGVVSAVNECLNGKRTHHKGYTFEYANDEWKVD